MKGWVEYVTLGCYVCVGGGKGRGVHWFGNSVLLFLSDIFSSRGLRAGAVERRS